MLCELSRSFRFSSLLFPGSLVDGCSRIDSTIVSVLSEKASPEKKLGSIATVSYTHLTLPTKA